MFCLKKLIDVIATGDIRNIALYYVTSLVGKSYNDSNVLDFPENLVDQQMNEIVHSLLKNAGLLDILKGYLMYDASLNEDHPQKLILNKDLENHIAFLAKDPDPKFFTKKYFIPAFYNCDSF